MNRIITYCYDEDGLVYSRVGSEIAIPVLDFDSIGKDGDFTAPLTYTLEKDNVLSLASVWRSLTWTKKIPVEIKNRHRAFWGMQPLKP